VKHTVYFNGNLDFLSSILCNDHVALQASGRVVGVFFEPQRQTFEVLKHVLLKLGNEGVGV
jgi:hypothetical protein